MNSYEFLDTVCGEIKYKSIHNAIRQELGAHIEETAEQYVSGGCDKAGASDQAVAAMGNPQQIGRMFNKQYRLPFNSRAGLGIWAALVTIIIYLAYPFLFSLWKNRIIKQPYSDFLIIGLIFVFMAFNVLYLRRGRKIVAIRDMAHVTAGFLIGYAVSGVILVIASRLTVTLQNPYPHYAYMPEVSLPFAPPYIPLLPVGNQNVFAMQGFCWWFCIIVYVAAVKSRKEVKPSFIMNCFHIYTIADGKILDDFDTFMNGVYRDGTKMKYFGIHMDKAGGIVTDRINKDGK